MSVKVRNLTNRLVLLRLNSGVTLHLGPRMTSSEIMDVEINGNRKLDELAASHTIAVHKIGKKRRVREDEKAEVKQPSEEPVTGKKRKSSKSEE